MKIIEKQGKARAVIFFKSFFQISADWYQHICWYSVGINRYCWYTVIPRVVYTPACFWKTSPPVLICMPLCHPGLILTMLYHVPLALYLHSDFRSVGSLAGPFFSPSLWLTNPDTRDQHSWSSVQYEMPSLPGCESPRATLTDQFLPSLLPSFWEKSGMDIHRESINISYSFYIDK